MSNWTHHNHNRRRGDVVTILGTEATVYICLDCREQGLTKEDISQWAAFSAADYKRHASWLDPQWFELTRGEEIV